jgi:hypothetical protein
MHVLEKLKPLFGASPLDMDGHGDGALQYAAASASVDVIRTPLAAKADPTTRDSYEKEPMEELERYFLQEADSRKQEQAVRAIHERRLRS